MSRNIKSPFIHHSATTGSLSLDVFIAIVPLAIFSCIFFGIRPLVVAGISILTALICEYIGCLFLKKKPSLYDGSAIVTALIITSMVSPIAPFWLTVIATTFAILIVKIPFGGTGRNIFNPAAAGIAFLTVCFPNLIFMYPDTEVDISASIFVFDVTTAPSPASCLRTGGSSPYPWYNLLLGQVPGAIGTTAIIVLVACAVFLFVRKSASPVTTVSFLVTCALIAALFPRTNGGVFQSILLELCSGYLIFGSIFLLNDPVTTPSHTLARAVFGILVGILVMLFRHIGQYEEGMCFAILLCNTVSTSLDRICWSFLHNRKKRKEAAI